MRPLELAAPFALGLVGSLHCLLMCGPLVLAYSMPMAGLPMRGHAIAHAGYNLGRLATYAALGALAGRFRSIAAVTLLLLVVPLTWSVRETRDATAGQPSRVVLSLRSGP